MARSLDTHLHLDDRIPGQAGDAAVHLNSQLRESGVARAIVLHLEAQRWPVEEVSEALACCDRLVGFINIHPAATNAKQQLTFGIEKLGFIGLKLHPRLQKFAVDDSSTHEFVRYAGDSGVPVLIDAFPDGTFLEEGFSTASFARLARACPKTRIIVAHMAGHHVIDMMMLAKRCPNLFSDCAYSLLYYRGSSVTTDLVYAMKSMKFERVFYGSDYPDRPIQETLVESIEVLERQQVSALEMDKLLYSNAKEFFSWNDI